MLVMEARLLRCLCEVEDLVKDWNEKTIQISRQIESLKNLAMQLETLKKCQYSDTLGVLNCMSSTVRRLEGKIVSSQQRALLYIKRDKDLMNKTVRKLLQKNKLAKKIWKDLVESRGIEVVSERTVDGFSMTDWLSWIQEVTCLIYSEWAVKRMIDFTAATDNEWDTEINGLSDICKLMRYTLQNQ